MTEMWWMERVRNLVERCLDEISDFKEENEPEKLAEEEIAILLCVEANLESVLKCMGKR